jgi:hypothetical protein
MNTQRIALSLALLASVPTAVIRATDNIQQENNSDSTLLRAEQLIIVIENQGKIKTALRKALDLAADATKAAYDLVQDTLSGLELILANQDDIIAMLREIVHGDVVGKTKEAIKLSEGEEIRGIILILANQHSIIGMLRTILKLDIDTTEKQIAELFINDEFVGVQAILANQSEILEMAESVAAL